MKERRRRLPATKPSPYRPKTGSSKPSQPQRLAQKRAVLALKQQEAIVDMHLDPFGISRHQSVEVAAQKRVAAEKERAQERRQKEREVSKQCRSQASEWSKKLVEATWATNEAVAKEEVLEVEEVEEAHEVKEPETQQVDDRVSAMFRKLQSRKTVKMDGHRADSKEHGQVAHAKEVHSQEVAHDAQSGSGTRHAHFVDDEDTVDGGRTRPGHCLGGEEVLSERSSLIATNFMAVMQQRRTVKPSGTLEHRISTLVKNQQMKRKQARIKRRYEAKKARFLALPEFEQVAMRQAFSHYDEDGSETLNVKELNSCLAELGLRGKNSEERAAVVQACSKLAQQLTADAAKEAGDHSDHHDDEELKNISVEIDMYVLVIDLLPQIRERLQDQRRSALLQLFTHSADATSGKLGVEECRNIAKTMDLQPEIISAVIKEFVPGDAKDKIDFEVFQRLISRLHEITDRQLRRKEREIKEKTQLDEETFNQFRRELESLHTSFSEFDQDHSGNLDCEEVIAMMKEFGLLPRTAEDRKQLEEMVRKADSDGEGGLDFKEFLDLVSQLRKKCMSNHKEEQKHFFDRHDKDKSGQLSVAEVSAVLADLNMTPKSHEEQHEIRILIQDVDEDGSGELDFQEFQMLSQRVTERLMMLNLEAGKNLALELGFSLDELKELRSVFDRLDEDGSNAIDFSEGRQALTLLKRDIPQEQFRQVWNRIDVDGSEELDFGEFLRLMNILNDSESQLSAGKRRVETLMYVEVETLRQILEIFKLGKEYILSLAHEECAQIAADSLGVGKSESLSHGLKVNTVEELIAAAKDKANKPAKPTF